MKKLTLLSPINARLSKRVSVSQLLRSEINQQSTDDNVGWDASAVNQPTSMPLNEDTSNVVRTYGHKNTKNLS